MENDLYIQAQHGRKLLDIFFFIVKNRSFKPRGDEVQVKGGGGRGRDRGKGEGELVGGRGGYRKGGRGEGHEGNGVRGGRGYYDECQMLIIDNILSLENSLSPNVFRCLHYWLWVSCLPLCLSVQLLDCLSVHLSLCFCLCLSGYLSFVIISYSISVSACICLRFSVFV